MSGGAGEVSNGTANRHRRVGRDSARSYRLGCTTIEQRCEKIRCFLQDLGVGKQKALQQCQCSTISWTQTICRCEVARRLGKEKRFLKILACSPGIPSPKRFLRQGY